MGDEGDIEDSSDDVPIHISQLMARAWDLRELHEVGAVFTYPDALTSEEWIALRSLQSASRKYEEQARKKAEEEAEMREREQRVRQMTGR
jgi:hypothetical protein